MDIDRYAAFLPAAHTADMPSPRSSWWAWRDRKVHIAVGPAPDAAARVMVLHGGGGHSGALWPVANAAVRGRAEILAPDLPLYGATREPHPRAVRYDDWIDLLCDLVVAEHRADPRPLILFGASMGGMLAYEVAARTGVPDAVVATCLLDMQDPRARAAATRFASLGRPAPALLRAADPVFGWVRLPIRWLADMTHMSGDPALSRLCASDPRGGGARVPVGFLASWMNYRHTDPGTYTGAPVTLVAPAADTWTPPQLSVEFLRRIPAPTTLVMLDDCGHFPVEEPGLTQLRHAVGTVLTEVAARAG